MGIDLMILGLIFDIFGVFILTLVAIIDYPHRREFGEKDSRKRYSWSGWCPIFKIEPSSEKPKWMVKWTHTVVRYGILPPKYQGNIAGFLCILVGFIFQLKSYLS